MLNSSSLQKIQALLVLSGGFRKLVYKSPRNVQKTRYEMDFGGRLFFYCWPGSRGTQVLVADQPRDG